MKKVEFKQIAGYKNEIKELQDLSNVLKREKELLNNGFRFPRGVLILGKPGVGKSILAESLISESQVYSVKIDIESVDEFNLSVYLDKKFKEAIDNAPSIIFIDELDKICGDSGGFGPSEDNDKVRKLIKVMNENTNDKVMVLATANDDRMIGSALKRSGRFDRVLNIPTPNTTDRKEILQYYLKNKELDRNLHISNLAKMTCEFTGADLECLVNEAGINASINNRTKLKTEDFDKVIKRMVFEATSREVNLNKGDLMMVATHEAGHIVASLLLDKNSVQSASISPIGETNGHVITMPDDNRLPSRDSVLRKVVIMLSGKAAEKMIDNVDYLGSSADILFANNRIQYLVTETGCYGFEYTLTGFHHLDNNISEHKKALIEKKCSEILKECYDRAYNLILNNIKLLTTFSRILFKKYSLSREEILKIYEKFNEESTANK